MSARRWAETNRHTRFPSVHWKLERAYALRIRSWLQTTAQSFFGWNAKSATVGGVTVQGVQRGMNEPPKVVASQAHETEKPSIYAPGDHVMHRKFGRGAVVRVSGSGSDARIMIRFDDVAHRR